MWVGEELVGQWPWLGVMVHGVSKFGEKCGCELAKSPDMGRVDCVGSAWMGRSLLQNRGEQMGLRCVALGVVLAGGSAAFGGDVFLLDFESASGYSTSVTEFTDGSTDYFMRTDGSHLNSGTEYFGADGSYFAGQDMDSEPGIGLPVYLTTDTFSIDGYTDLMFAIDLAEDDAFNGDEDWDAGDSVVIEYQLDGGAWTEFFRVENDGSTFNSAAFVDGVEVTDTFQSFSADLSALSGSTLALRMVWDLNAGDEDLAVDNLRISGNLAVVPLPPAAWGGLGMLGLMAGLRKRLG